MVVQIRSCKSDMWWYADRIGDCFEAENDRDREDFYIVWHAGKKMNIAKSDTKIIENATLKLTCITDDDKKEINSLFHRLWSANVGKEGYVKKNWSKLQNLLCKVGIPV